MAELRPYPFSALVTRMLRELDERQSIFDLPEPRFFLGDPTLDLSVDFHGHRAATPLGPAAGPQSQMAQNIVLSWLGGCRIMELKTVQIDDRLAIPRPCIDMQTVGYNVEWSQELRLEESLEEYVKGAMLVEILAASGRLELAPGFERTLYDMSVGYDLAGIQSEPVQAFVRGMLDCGEVVERLRREIPLEYKEFRDLDFARRLSDTLTLSTFHGCPPEEIERIITFLLERNGLHCIVKLNPMLLGAERTRELLGDVLGYEDVRCPDSAFERDTTWEEAQGFVERLGERAAALGLGFGVKFTNTLIVENHKHYLPASSKEMYLSGAPLHVLAMDLVGRFRARFGDRYPISFSGGIDRKNFPDAVALGLVPVTVCSDLLKPGGYARARGYFDELRLRMQAVGATSIDEWIARAYGGEVQPRERAVLANTARYVTATAVNPRYAAAANSRLPRKIGSSLELFDCVSCDKCVPVCPNDANFVFELSPIRIPIVKVSRTGAGWTSREDGELVIERREQYANFQDFCNDCGNCDVFCPEDGGPYVIKPRFFGRLDDWKSMAHLDGFHLAREGGPGGDSVRVYGRFDGVELELSTHAGSARYSGPGFELTFEERNPLGTLAGRAEGEVDLVYYHLMRAIARSVLGEHAVNFVSCGLAPAGPDTS
ncbi:MAG: glutamate synthase [Planctomycetota bacterium]|nr:MAG: glutamate synthase [Planctomycetota bacterium]